MWKILNLLPMVFVINISVAHTMEFKEDGQEDSGHIHKSVKQEGPIPELTEEYFLEQHNRLLSLRNQKTEALKKDVIFLEEFTKKKSEEIETSFQELRSMQKLIKLQNAAHQEVSFSNDIPFMNTQNNHSPSIHMLKKSQEAHKRLFLEAIYYTFEIQKEIKHKKETIQILDIQISIISHKIFISNYLKNNENK